MSTPTNMGQEPDRIDISPEKPEQLVAPTGLVDNDPRVKPGLIDTALVVVTPKYDWAGTSIGNQNVTECSMCGVMIRIDSQDAHTRFHGIIQDIQKYVGVQ